MEDDIPKILVNGKEYGIGDLFVDASTYTPLSGTNWTFVTDTLASAIDEDKESGCLERMMDKTNPKTKELYTKEEAKRICSRLADKKVATSSIEPIQVEQIATFVSSIECSDKDARMYHFMVADDKTLAKGSNGLYQYTSESHEDQDTLDSWIGTEVTYGETGTQAHDKIFPIGRVYDAWADQEGLHQVIRVVESSVFDKIESDDLKVSIGTIPLEIDNQNVKRYEPNHLAMFHKETPGCDSSRCNIRGVVSSTGDEKMPEENPTPPQAVDETALRSSIEAEVNERLEKKYELKMLVSSVANETGIEAETITKIAGGGVDAVTALQSCIAKLKEDAKEVVVSKVGDANTEEEPEHKSPDFSCNKKE